MVRGRSVPPASDSNPPRLHAMPLRGSRSEAVMRRAGGGGRQNGSERSLSVSHAIGRLQSGMHPHSHTHAHTGEAVGGPLRPRISPPDPSPPPPVCPRPSPLSTGQDHCGVFRSDGGGVQTGGRGLPGAHGPQGLAAAVPHAAVGECSVKAALLGIGLSCGARTPVDSPPPPRGAPAPTRFAWAQARWHGPGQVLRIGLGPKNRGPGALWVRAGPRALLPGHCTPPHLFPLASVPPPPPPPQPPDPEDEARRPSASPLPMSPRWL